jgi:hypothetical protein
MTVKIVERNSDGSPKAILATHSEMVAAGYNIPPYFVGVYEDKPMSKPKRIPLSKAEVNDVARDLVEDFRVETELFRRDGDRIVAIPVRSLTTDNLRVVAKAARQITELGLAAERILNERQRNDHRNYDRDRKFAGIRALSKQLKLDGKGHRERVHQAGLFKTMKPVQTV